MTIFPRPSSSIARLVVYATRNGGSKCAFQRRTTTIPPTAAAETTIHAGTACSNHQRESFLLFRSSQRANHPTESTAAQKCRLYATNIARTCELPSDPRSMFETSSCVALRGHHSLSRACFLVWTNSERTISNFGKIRSQSSMLESSDAENPSVSPWIK